jgi:predicted phage terminase large subunit-like protein
MGESNFVAQYLQSPVPEQGAMIKECWFKRYSREECPSLQFIVQSWDTANKVTELSDFSVGTTWGIIGTQYYLLDVFRSKLDYPALKRFVIDYKKKWNASTVIIEDRASGTQLIQELQHAGYERVIGYNQPTEDKTMRMHTCCDVIENGFVYLPDKAEWLPEFLHEIRAFPNGRHDDQVDSTSQALRWLKNRYLNYPTVSISPVRL